MIFLGFSHFCHFSWCLNIIRAEKVGVLILKMVQLYLSKPPSGGFGDGNDVRDPISLLKEVEEVIWSVITAGGRYEARIWLCNSISCIHIITCYDQRDLFVDLLRLNKSKYDVAAQLLQMVFEKRPQKVGPIIAKKSYMLEKFFEGNPTRILQWFDNFAMGADCGHKKGARAIAQFAFVNRDICWEELEWKGKHGQSPAVVATKPHYFNDLDVLRTVENFLEYVPDFWSSDELADSVKDGEILKIDAKFFIDQFIQLLYEDNLEDIWVVIEDFLMEVEFSYLSQHILILLDEGRLFNFLTSLGKHIHLNENCKGYEYPSCWLENILSKCNDCMSLDELLLLNAVISHGRQLLRLFNDEEHQEYKEKAEEALRKALVFGEADHWALLKDCEHMKLQVAIKWMGLQSWIIHYSLSRECSTQQSYESLFRKNGISFRKSNEYSLVRSDGFSTLCSSDSDGDDLATKSGHKRRKRDKKRRRKKYDHDGNNAVELVELDTFGGQQNLQFGGSNWQLSTDGYSCVWNTVSSFFCALPFLILILMILSSLAASQRTKTLSLGGTPG